MVGLKSLSCLSFLRLYTGIHALKKPKSKTGAISESTTALNVNQTNNALQSVKVPLPAAPLPTASRGTGLTEQDQNTVGPVTEAAAGVAVAAVQKKGVAVAAKAPADRKVVDARKKSLKRL